MSKLFTKHFSTLSYDKLNETVENKNTLEYNICNFRSNIIFKNKKYVTIYDIINSNESKVYNKEEFGDKRIVYPMLHFPIIKENYSIIFTSKSYNTYPFIHTINENYTSFRSSYYKDEYEHNVKKFIDNIRIFYKDYKTILFDMIIIGYDINNNIIMYLTELLKEFSDINIDIKIRDMKKEGFNDNWTLVKYNIKKNLYYFT
tara:strand:- start:24 stop:629 length:606 start_codon:yes stop_codon:yes gene_type:complete